MAFVCAFHWVRTNAQKLWWWDALVSRTDSSISNQYIYIYRYIWMCALAGWLASWLARVRANARESPIQTHISLQYVDVRIVRDIIHRCYKLQINASDQVIPKWFIHKHKICFALLCLYLFCHFLFLFVCWSRLVYLFHFYQIISCGGVEIDLSFFAMQSVLCAFALRWFAFIENTHIHTLCPIQTQIHILSLRSFYRWLAQKKSK